MATESEGPQSCYPDDIKTLREMISEQRSLIASLAEEIRRRKGLAPAGLLWAQHQAEKRIQALQTSIEALAGAL